MKKRPLILKFFIAMLTILLVYGTYEKIILSFYGVYAIAKITTIRATKWGPEIQYEFRVHDKTYRGSTTNNFVSKQKDAKYFVLFWEKHPAINSLQYDKPVPSCLIDNDEIIWEKIPVCH